MQIDVFVLREQDLDLAFRTEALRRALTGIP
jgi:hypothetical protein